MTPASHWEWWYTPHGDRLHYLAAMEVPAAYARIRDAIQRPRLTARCGLRAVFAPAGFVSRTSMPRCAACCRKLGIAPGVGTPRNESARRAR